MRRLLPRIGVAAMAMTFLGVLGCAAGRNEQTGEVVVGFGVARLTETANQGLAQLGDYFLPGAGAALAAVGLPVLGWARAYGARRAAEAQHAGENTGWQDALTHHSVPPVIAQPVVAAAPAASPAPLA